MPVRRHISGALVVLLAACGLASCGGTGETAKLQTLIRAHPFAFVPELKGSPADEIGAPVQAPRVKCTRRGYLAGVGTDYSCDVAFPGVETSVCAAPFEHAAIMCHSDRGVNCPRYVPPSSRSGNTTFGLSSAGWVLRYPRRFSLYLCVGSGFNTGFVEIGVSNFNAQGGRIAESWPATLDLPATGVLLIVGSYDAGFLIAPQPDTRLPLAPADFHRGTGFRFPTAQVWHGGDSSFVHLYIGPRANTRDRAAVLAALRSLRFS